MGFLHSVQVQRVHRAAAASAEGSMILQTVSTGDLVAVSWEQPNGGGGDDDEIAKHFRRMSPWKMRQRVGQVLAIRQDGANEFHAVLQWLLPVQYVKAAKLVEKKEMDKVNKIMRPHFMLWAQTAPRDGVPFQDVVNLKQLLPVAVVLQPHTDFDDVHQIPVELKEGCFQFGFHCHYTLPSVPGGTPTDCGPADFVPTPSSQQAAKTVSAAWKQLHLEELSEPQRKNLVKQLTKSYNATQLHKAANERFQLVAPPNLERKECESIASMNSVQAEKRKPAPKKRAIKAKAKVSAAPKSKKRRSTGSAASLDSSRSSKKGRFNDDEQTKTTTTTTSSLPAVCFEYKRRNKPTLLFYDRVELEQSHPQRIWTINVGDVIAVACEDARAGDPIYSLNRNKKAKRQSVWYPFHQPWSPAQVVAIYTKGGGVGTVSDDDTFMQLRWFYRPSDLPDEVVEHLRPSVRQELFEDDYTTSTEKRLLSGRRLVEVDEDWLEVSVASALGRIVPTSVPDPSLSWLDSFQDAADGVPQLPVVCRHIFRMKDFSGAEGCSRLKGAGWDWTDYSITTHTSVVGGPLYRGIACPKVWPGKVEKLFKAYGGKDFVQARAPPKNKKAKVVSFSDDFVAADDDDAAANEDNDDSSTDSSLDADGTAWPEDLLANYGTHGRVERKLCICKQASGPDREYLQHLSILVPAKRYNPRVTGRKSFAGDSYQNTLKIGDVVCIAYNGASKMVPKGEKKNSWFPFVGPWRICQVLNIYREVESAEQLFLEVRWFLRESDLPPHVLTWKPGVTSEQQEEVYETDLIESGIPVSHVLGRAELFLGRHSQPSNKKKEQADNDTATVSFRCRYFYHSSIERFQPLFCSDPSPHRWFLRMMKRGFQFSPTIRDNSELSQCIEMGLDNIRLFQRESTYSIGGSMGFVDKSEESLEQRAIPFDMGKENAVTTSNTYYLSLPLYPQWSKFEFPDIVCSVNDRNGLKWTVRVGDVVAVEAASSAADSKTLQRKNFPFTVTWKPAQILAIYREKSDCFRLEIRWFVRQSDLQVSLKKMSANGLDLLFSTDDVCAEPVDVAKLLGPVALFSLSDRTEFRPSHIGEALAPYLPVAACFYSGHFDTTKQQKVAAPSLCNLVEEGVKLSAQYPTDDVRKQMRKALRAEARDTDRAETSEHRPLLQYYIGKDESNEGSRGMKTWTSIPPFHVDRSKGIQYFTELDVRPSGVDYSIDTLTDSHGRVWTVKLGDTVALRCADCAGRAIYCSGAVSQFQSLERKYWPFRVPWAVGEIVSIMRPFSDAYASASGSNEESHDEISLDIRWFSRENDLPGKSRPVEKESELLCEELFESDLLDEVDSSMILAPVMVYENAQTITLDKTHLCMPVVEFHCHRFWSYNRKSFVPIGGQTGRVGRARAHSTRIRNDASLQASLDRITLTSAPTFAPQVPWTEAFKNVIQKLSLTDASKEAYENGSVLVGREQERKQIMSFLRNSIRGKSNDNSKGSVFVAGPPGVGKTAVRIRRKCAAGFLEPKLPVRFAHTRRLAPSPVHSCCHQ